MLGTSLVLNKQARSIIKKSIETIIPTLKIGEISQYQLAASKLNDKEVYIDGIILRCYENALNYKARIAEYKLERIVYENLEENIKKQRENFQFQAMSRLGLVAI